MLDKMKKAYTFDDVLLVPNYSDVLPHEACTKTKLTRNLTLDIPIISAAMDTVTTSTMAIALAKLGGIGIIHKNMSIESQAQEVKLVSDKNLMVGAAIGVSDDGRFEKLIEAGVDVIVVDTAHGHSKGVIERIKWIKEFAPQVDVIGGNIATEVAALALVEAGVDAVKVGIGPGSICTTRIVAGVGFPQLSAVNNIAQALIDTDIPVIADGGIRFSGDIAKAIAAGASSIMLGSLLSGTTESPGELSVVDGMQYKAYRGMGSMGAMQDGSADRYFQSGVDRKKLVPEGVEAKVKFKGDVSDVVYQLVGGLRQAMGYVGAKTIQEMQLKSRFVEITQAGILESHVHDVELTKTPPNYKRS